MKNADILAVLPGVLYVTWLPCALRRFPFGAMAYPPHNHMMRLNAKYALLAGLPSTSPSARTNVICHWSIVIQGVMFSLFACATLSGCQERAEAPANDSTAPPIGAGDTVSTPFEGQPYAIPGTIEAEHFDKGDSLVAYRDRDDVNQGVDYRGPTHVDIEARDDASNGHGIGWTKKDEWVLYTVTVKEAGKYRVMIPVASRKLGGTFHLEFDGHDVTGPIQVPDTGGWQTLQVITKGDLPLNEGTQIMRLVMDSEGPSQSVADIDYLKFEKQ